MVRKKCLVIYIYFCLISLATCRHLDNTVSDARTKQKPVAEMLNAEPETSLGSDVKPTNLAQILPTVSSRDAENYTTTTVKGILIDETSKAVDSKDKELAQPAQENVSDVDPTQSSTAQSTTDQDNSKETTSDKSVVTKSKIDIYHSIKRKGKVMKTQDKTDSGDFKKEHAHIEASAAVFPTNSSMPIVGDKEESTNHELPYDKLDNVNVVAVDNSPPVVRPVLNHLDNDKVNKIETISTVNDIEISPGANSESATQAPRDNIVNKENSNNMTDLLSEVETKEILPTASSMETSPVTTTKIASTETSAKTDEIPTLAPVPIQTSADPTTPPNKESDVVLVGEGDRDVRATPESKTDADDDQKDPEDVDPLDIFVDDIKYQRFPDAMPLSLFKEKISGKKFKKLYILESSEKKLFQHVRQLEVTYDLDGNDLYAEFLFRFIYSRQCTRIERFKLGTMSNNSQYASFEKEVEGDKTERLVFFSQRPDDYVFFMSCTDMKTSPYACRDSYYVTLDSKHDPPNQFPWLSAAQELESQMNLNFQDPRFIFNFVMMPCARS